MLCIALADVWLRCSCSAMKTHSMKLSTHCSWANMKPAWSWEVFSDLLYRKLATSVHYAPQHPLTQLHHLMWLCGLSVIPNHFHFVIIPLTVDCGIFRSEEISQLDLLQRWHPITVPRWNSPSSYQRPILSQMFAETLHAKVLAFIHHWPLNWSEYLISIIWMGE